MRRAPKQFDAAPSQPTARLDVPWPQSAACLMAINPSCVCRPQKCDAWRGSYKRYNWLLLKMPLSVVMRLHLRGNKQAWHQASSCGRSRTSARPRIAIRPLPKARAFGELSRADAPPSKSLSRLRLRGMRGVMARIAAASSEMSLIAPLARAQPLNSSCRRASWRRRLLASRIMSSVLCVGLLFISVADR